VPVRDNDQTGEPVALDEHVDRQLVVLGPIQGGADGVQGGALHRDPRGFSSVPAFPRGFPLVNLTMVGRREQTANGI
jgi:hypothetical protein